MPPVSPELKAAYERRLDLAKVPAALRPDYHKWVRLFLYFCQKFGYGPSLPTSRGPFLNKLTSVMEPVEHVVQASAAIRLLLRRGRGPGDTLPVQGAQVPPGEPAGSPGLDGANPGMQPNGVPAAGEADAATATAPGRAASWEREYRELEAAIRMRNYSRKTLASYRWWVVKFQAFVRSRPTAELGTQEVRGFLSELAVRYGVAASSQNQAFNALLFFFRHVLGHEFGQLDGVVRAKRHRYVPVVLSRPEMEAVLGHLQPPYRLVGLLLYGCGLRLAECVNLEGVKP